MRAIAPHRVRIGVIGTGWWATHAHIPSLLANDAARLVALADPSPDRLGAAAARFGNPTTYTDYRELISSGELEGIVVSTPHAAHYGIARAGLDAGLHVLVEKPMTIDVADAFDLVERAHRGGLHLVVGYTYQFTRQARETRRLIESGAIGDLILVAASFPSVVESYLRGRPGDYATFHDFRVTAPAETTYSDPQIAGGGQGQTQVTHLAGMLFWATGTRPAAVSAFMSNRDLQVDLADVINFRLDNGAIGAISATGSLRPGQPPQQELVYYGTEGVLAQRLAAGTLSAHFNDGRTYSSPDLSEDEIYPLHAPSQCLVDLIRGQGENLGPPDPAAVTVAFLEAAYRSAELGSVVQLQPTPRIVGGERGGS